MKNLLFTIFTFLIIFNANAQEDVINLFTIDSWNGSNWSQIGQSNYSYNNNCLLTELSSQFINATTGNLQNSNRSIFTFNGDDLTESVTNQIWDATGNQWLNQSRTEFFYTGSNATESRNSQWTNGIWEVTGRSLLTYNSSDLVTDNTVQDFDNVNSIWINNSKTTITYNSNDLTDTFTSLTWNTSTLIWNNVSRQVSQYSNNILSSRQSDNWTNGTWENNRLESFSYDNNNFLIETLNKIWNGSVYEDNIRLNYTNDANGNQIETITQVWISASNSWLNNSRSNASFSSCLVTSTKELFDAELSVYPNPVSEKVQLITNSTFNGTASLFDVMGRIVFSDNIASTQNTIDVSRYTEGLYFLVLENQNQKITKQLIIQR